MPEKSRPSISKEGKNKILRLFHCPVCKVKHQLYFPKDFADNRVKYPFSYVYLHKLKETDDIENLDKDILTTLYVDSNLNIRGVEAVIIEDEANILSKDDSRKIITNLTKTILDMQEDYEKLYQKYKKLKGE